MDLIESLQSQAVNQCCTLIYTSGTTGNPKGVMLSHDNIAWNVFSLVAAVDMKPNEEVFISYLPLNHIAAQLTELWVPLLCQVKDNLNCFNSILTSVLTFKGQVFFGDKNALKGTLIDTIRFARPTKILGVPRVWEKIMEAMKIKGREITGLKRKVIDMCKLAAIRHHLYGDDSMMYK